MPNKGGYTAAPPPPRQSGDRFYNPPVVWRHQQILMQQQQMIQRQLLHQQQQHLHHQQQLLQQQQQQQQEHQRQMQRKGKAKVGVESPSSTPAEPEMPTAVDDSSTVAALTVPRSLNPASSLEVTNLDRFMDSVTPFFEARFSSEVKARGPRTSELDSNYFFYLDDLWESFSEWSVYGRGVPLLLNGKDSIEQYYVPFLSGMQLYVEPSKASAWTSGSAHQTDSDLQKRMSTAGSSRYQGGRGAMSVMDLNSQRLSGLSMGDKSTMSSASPVANLPAQPVFQYLETDPPFNRKPLSDMISGLASKIPMLKLCKSCDLCPTSWLVIAWYPIYRIPVGSTLKDLEASFLTFHSLSTQSRSSFPSPQFHEANTSNPTARFSLPVFGLASYKLKGSILSPFSPKEREQEERLRQAADNWLKSLHVPLHDFQFFSNPPYSRRR